MIQTTIVLAILAIIGLHGCSEDCGCDQLQDEGSAVCDWFGDAEGNGMTTEDTSFPTTESDLQEPSFEAFEVPIDQQITVGAFVLDLQDALFNPGASTHDPYAYVEVSFQAHNASENVAMPLVPLEGDGLVLDAAGNYYFGRVATQEVPGLRDGVGTVSWAIWDELTENDLRNAVITFGEAGHNQAVLPLSDLTALINHADQELETQFLVKGYRSTTLDLPIARVQYNLRGNNVPLPVGTAILVLEGFISADPDMRGAGQVWSEEDVFLTRPDGISVAPKLLNEAVHPGDREELTLIFDLVMPVAGTYILGVVDQDLLDETQAFVIP